MSLQADRFKVGVFLILSGSLFILFLAFVVGRTLLRSELHYFIRFKETVKGLAPGAQVNFHGVPVGSVQSMRLSQDTTVVRISMDPAKAMVQRRHTRAALERNPVTGLATVELDGWRPDGEPLPAEGEILADESWGARMFKTFPEILGEIPATLKGIRDAAQAIREILDPAMKERLGGVLTNLDGLSARLPKALDELNRESRETMLAIKKTAEGLAEHMAGLHGTLDGLAGETKETLAEARGAIRSGREFVEGERLRSLLAALDRAAGEATTTLAGLRRSMAGTEATLGGVGRDLTPLMARLGDAAEAIGRLAALLRDQPSALIWADPGRERGIPDPVLPARRK